MQAENQRLRDEVNRLKGEQGKPTMKPNRAKPANPPRENYSSEQERRKTKPRQKQAQTDKLEIHREQTLGVDPASLPADAEFKGYKDVVVQDVIFQANNICFHKEKYRVPSQGETILAPMPLGYEGQFGDEEAFVIRLDTRWPNLAVQQRQAVLSAAAVAACHAAGDVPIVRQLVCNDAPQFNWIAEQLALCWVHEAWHYKKLGISVHQYVLDRRSKASQVPSLAGLIGARAVESRLGASWSAV